MKKLFVLLLFTLCGCVHSPVYYSHTQEITMTIPKNAHAEYEGKILEADKNNIVRLNVYRSWFDKEVIIKKEGYKDYHLKLDSVWTDEKWAEKGGIQQDTTKTSAFDLLIPRNTVTAIYFLPLTIISPFIELDTLETAEFEGKLLLSIPYNIISIPGLPLINPWAKYVYDSNIVMEPLEKISILD